jgi:hypothetical protein
MKVLRHVFHFEKIPFHGLRRPWTRETIEKREKLYSLYISDFKKPEPFNSSSVFAFFFLDVPGLIS